MHAILNRKANLSAHRRILVYKMNYSSVDRGFKSFFLADVFFSQQAMPKL